MEPSRAAPETKGAAAPDPARTDAAPIVQRKLAVGSASDPAELEADRMADAAMRTAAGRSPGVRLGGGPTRIARSSTALPPAGVVGPGGDPLDASTERAIDRARGTGRPMEPALRDSMEAGFDADFSGVRLHVGADSDSLNERLGARAFTAGSDVFVRRSDYAPDRPSGRHLIAHELAHTIQQGSVPVGANGRIRRSPTVVRRVLSPDSTSTRDWDNLQDGKTGQGVNGVVFATAATGEQIVVKGLQEAPQRAMLAQQLMAQAGVRTTHTKAVAAGSRLGRHILTRLDQLGATLGANGASIQAKAQAWGAFRTLLLMDAANVHNLRELATTGPGLAPAQAPQLPVPANAGGLGGHRAMAQHQQQQAQAQHQADLAQYLQYWQTLLGRPALWRSFGKIFYLDQFLGNEDRFETLKIQNVFIDDATGEAVAMDNDTMAADYISQITDRDAVTNPHNPQNVITNTTPDQYIDRMIQGAWVYNQPLQDRMMGSLDAVAGTNTDLRNKVHQKVDDLLNNLLQGVTGQPGVHQQAAVTVVTNLLAGNNSAQQKADMLAGAGHARNMIRTMFHNQAVNRRGRLKNRSRFQQLVRDTEQDHGDRHYRARDETMFNHLAFDIRFAYLEARSGAPAQNHAAALLSVQNQFRAQVQAMARTASTDLHLDPNTLATTPQLVNIT